MYNVSAVQTALFPKKAKYPKSPQSMREEEEVEEMSSEDQFMAWAAAFNAGHDNLPEYGEESHEHEDLPERGEESRKPDNPPEHSEER